ncbi:hypothetical protein LCGC14_1876010 [marine sediment metagenome]|uniref:Uncharacterized protein n=1 Tax=marine sediment metagenome TaxID=412755 RepID=A0A0F9J2B3_9ZZZZ
MNCETKFFNSLMETGMNKQNPLTESEKRMLRGIRPKV